MTDKDKEIERLRKLAQDYRNLMARLISDGRDYTDGEDCVWCSGWDGYLSASESETGEIAHAPDCPTLEVAKLDGQEI